MGGGADEAKVKPWRVSSSRITYQDRWITLRSDDCVTEAGVVIAPYHVIDYPDWVNVVALTRDLKLLMVREYRHGREIVTTGLVAGAVEPGEAAVAAAARELQEETAYGRGRLIPVLESYPNAANHSNKVTSFLAIDLELNGECNLDASETIEVVFMDFAEVLKRLRRGEITLQAMHVAALWSAAALILAGGDDLRSLSPLRDALRNEIAPSPSV